MLEQEFCLQLADALLSSPRKCKASVCKQAIDSVIGANSAQLRDKILSQIPDDPRKTKQIATNLHLCVGERTEIASNVRTDDGMTNGAGNIIKRIQLNHKR